MVNTHYTVRINKPTRFGIIVPAAEIIQPTLSVIHIPPIAEGVDEGDVIRVRNRMAIVVRRDSFRLYAPAPCVIGIRRDQLASVVVQPDHVALPVVHKIVRLPYVRPDGAVVVVDAVQAPAGVQDRSHVLAVAAVHTRVLLSAIIILRRDPIGNLFRPPSVDIVFVARRLAALRQRRKLPPVRPRQRHAPVAQRIPDGIVGDRLPVVARQQVLPTRVPVGVAHRLGRRSQRPRRV